MRWYSTRSGTLSVLSLHCFAMQGWTALHYAACDGHVEFVTLLLDQNASRTIVSKMVSASACSVVADTTMFRVICDDS